MVELTTRILRTLNQAKYAKRIKPVVELVAAKTARQAYYYARFIVEGSFPLGEKAIATDPYTSYQYATYVLHGPFPEGESVMASSPINAYGYAREVLRLPRSEAEAWGENYRNG